MPSAHVAKDATAAIGLSLAASEWQYGFASTLLPGSEIAASYVIIDDDFHKCFG